MFVDRYAVKADARERLRSASPRPYWEGLIFALLAGAMTALSIRVLSGKITPEAADRYLAYMMAGAYEQAIKYAATLQPSSLDSLVSMILELFRGIVAAGFCLFSINTLRRKEASLWNILDGFGRFLPLLLLVLITRTLVILWAQLLLIPGIIAAYRYRMSIYLMLDHPELSAFQSILLSGQLMRGKKWELFLMDLSFLGWAFLALLPLTVGSLFPGWFPLVLGALGTAAILAWLLPYYEMSCAGFYEAVKASVRPESPDNI